MNTKNKRMTIMEETGSVSSHKETPDSRKIPKQRPDTSYKWYALSLMLVVYVFNFIDRSILNILAQSIKQDLGLSDTELGFMGGLAFAVFYTFMGIPIARLADNYNRRNILAVCLAIWSAMTALCAAAQNFWHLLACRIGVAIGEAGGSPPCHSMISDFFDERQRATALGIYSLGIPIGSSLGYLVGGQLNEFFGWRIAFLAVGLPGVAMALVVRFGLREPIRGITDRYREVDRDRRESVLKVLSELWSKVSFRYISLGAAFHAFVGYGVAMWIPAMFERSHGLTSGTIGYALFLLGFPGMVGTFFGGWLSDRLGMRDKRWYVWISGLATLVSIPFAAYTYLYHDPFIALFVYIVPVFFGAFYLGPTFSLAQSLSALRARAVTASILLFILNIIGLGLGPWFVGIVSDILQHFTTLCDDSLRIALVLTLFFNILSTACYLLAGRSLKRDLRLIS